MIAEAGTWRQQRQQQERRRSAARQKTVEALWEDVAQRQREAWSAIHQAHAPASAASTPVAATPPEPAPRAAADSPRRFVVPNVIAGEAPLVRQPWPMFADVLRTYDPEYRRLYGAELTVQQDKVLREMLGCYTPLLGTHEWTCDDCGTVVELPNGCNNRHCCTCGSAKRRRWAEATCAQILPVKYQHVILTLPHPLTQLAIRNPRVVYPLVMSEGAQSILSCGRQLFDVELALLLLLHTWGQLVLNHVHDHCLLPCGGLRVGALQWIDLSPEQMAQLLEHVRYKFPQRLCRALRQACDEGQLQFDGDPELEHLPSPAAFEQWLEPLQNMPWIIRCGQDWDRRGAGHDLEATIQVVQYLANYVGRIALSDSRILDIQGDHVLFKYKDYRDGNQQKQTWIEGVELIRRFLQHLLPPRMHHIRWYGWLARRAHSEKLEWLQRYHSVAQAEPEVPEEPQEPSDEAEVDGEEQERTQACRFCPGRMHHSGSTPRPRVYEILSLPLSRFHQAQAGVRVTLGDQLPPLEVASQRSDLSPKARERSVEIRRQLSALLTSSGCL